MNKHPKVTDATREAFVSAFFLLAGKKKISQITIHEITDLAGYNRTTFYRYFEDVYALIEYSENELLENTRKTIEKQSVGGQLNESQFFRTFIQCFHENKDRISVLLSEENRAHFLRRISENVTETLYRKDNDTPKKKVIRDIYFFGIFYAISINLQSQDVLSDEDLLDIIRKMFDSWYLPEMRLNG